MTFTYGQVKLPADRRLFIPERIYVRDGGWLVPLRRSDSPREWERLVGLDDAVTTQTDENDPRLPGVDYPEGKGFFPTSSSSAPGVMARMIEALDLKPGMRVLEIGTGTGFNAACLAALGAKVVTIEIDPDLAGQARTALDAAGHADMVVLTGDGELGAADLAPYDRVICTAAAHTIPYPWVQQTRDGGIIVTPYTGTGRRYGTLVLHVSDGTATGGIEGDAAFMPLRGQFINPADTDAIQNRPGLRVEVSASGQRVFVD